jgi:hypothetical protein
MAEPISIACVADLRNAFVRGQHEIGGVFGTINGFDGVWEGMIPSSGSFPVGSGFAARVTTLGQQRLSFSRLNLWRPMVGMQGDCAVSCDPPTEIVKPGNGQNDWYRLLNVAYNTEPFCLESMFADSLNLEEQIAQQFRDLKFLSTDVMDEFYRNNYVALSRYRYFGYDNGTTQQFVNDGWRFATDADGNVDTTYVILDAGFDPENISALSVSGILNRIRDRGQYIGTFPKDGVVPLITDWQTFQELPLYDTNRRVDNRFRAPEMLNPGYAAVSEYAMFGLKNDPFSLRYFWTETEPGYPDGVLKRIDQWANQPLTNGCMSDLSNDYQEADFQISILKGQSPVFTMQNGEQPLSAGSGVTFADPASPWNGVWRFVNEVNEVTPCNQDRNKGYWRMNLKKAAKPSESGFRGNLVLHRRFPWRGIAKICRPLGTPTAGSYDCDWTCAPLDWAPPALEDVFTCGRWNPDTCTSVG